MANRLILVLITIGLTVVYGTTVPISPLTSPEEVTTGPTGPTGTATVSSVSRGTKKYEGTEAEARQDFEDNLAEASVASYSTVVIHHKPVASDKKDSFSTNIGSGGTKLNDGEASRSESYFKFYNPGHKRHSHEEKTTIVHSTERNNMLPNFRHVENFRIDEARMPHSLITHYHYKPSDTIREGNRFTNQINNNNNNKGEDFKPSFNLEETTFRPSSVNPLKDYRSEDRTKDENKYESSFTPAATSLRLEAGPELRGFDYRMKSYKPKPQPPPGMSEELMETLLQQEPQTFQDPDKIKRYESKKKSTTNKGRNNGSSFNVGYSIGFGNAQDDVVLGKPKDVKLHINGQKSIWKQLQGGVEMSQDLDSRRPTQVKVSDSSTKARNVQPHVNVLKNGAQSVFYMNSHSPDIANIPTAGKINFNHEQALTNSNVFDFSNAMTSPPIALPIQSVTPVLQESQHVPYSLKPKGRGYDLMNFYQTMGYNSPVPVYIPGIHGDAGQMVQAIVIPLESLNTIQMNWGNLANTIPEQSTLATPTTTINAEPIIHEKPPKRLIKQQYHQHRKPKDSLKSSTTYSTVSGSVGGPAVNFGHRPYNLQREQASLNAILAQELSRKNHRHVPIGLRPPPAQYS